jgi:GNAT superfamily N-acetyltransferase
MNLRELKIRKLSARKQLNDFETGFEAVDEYFYEDAFKRHSELLTKVYLVTYEKKLVAFFTLSNDKITLEDVENEECWKKFRTAHFPDDTNSVSFSALMIGYLGVDKRSQNLGIGGYLLNHIKAKSKNLSLSGARFLTVNSYREAFDFYLKNGFDFITEADKEYDTRLMYFDLLNR